MNRAPFLTLSLMLTAVPCLAACSGAEAGAPQGPVGAADAAPDQSADGGAAVDAAAPMATDAGAPACPPVWAASYAPAPMVVTHTFTPDGLILDATGPKAPVWPAELSQQALVGDFDATFTVADVEGTDAFDGAEAFVETLPWASQATVDLWGAPGHENVSAMTQSSSGFQQRAKWAGVADGVFTISRRGLQVTVTATAGGVSESQTLTMPGDLRLGLRLQRSDAGHAAFRVKSFEINGGGGGVKSDTFACDSTMP